MKVELKLNKKSDISVIANRLKHSDLKDKILELYNADDYANINYRNFKGLGYFVTNDDFMIVCQGVYDNCYKMTLRPQFGDKVKVTIIDYDDLAKKLAANSRGNKANILDKYFDAAIDNAIDILTDVYIQDNAYEVLDEYTTEMVEVKLQLGDLISEANNIINNLNSNNVQRSFADLAKKTKVILTNTVGLTDKLYKRVSEF